MSLILIIGPPGSGKSTLISSMTNIGLKVEYIDIDNKVDKMVNLAPLLKKGLIKAITLKAPLVEGTMRQRVTMLKTTPTNQKTLLHMPKGFLEFCDIIDGYEKDKAKGNTRKGWVLAVDTLTRLQEHMKRFLLYTDNKNRFTFDQWDIWKTNLEEMVARLMGLIGYFDHVAVLCHEQAEYNEDGNITGYRPMIDGSMRYKFGNYFEEEYVTYVKALPNQQPRFMVRTVSDAKHEARTSRDIPADVDSDFAVLFGGKPSKPVSPVKKGGTSAQTQIRENDEDEG